MQQLFPIFLPPKVDLFIFYSILFYKFRPKLLITAHVFRQTMLEFHGLRANHSKFQPKQLIYTDTQTHTHKEKSFIS